LIKYIKSVFWRVAKRLSYIRDARCLKVKHYRLDPVLDVSGRLFCYSEFPKFSTDPSAPWLTSYVVFHSNLRNVTNQFILKSSLSAVHYFTNNMLCISHTFSTATDKPSPIYQWLQLCW